MDINNLLFTQLIDECFKTIKTSIYLVNGKGRIIYINEHAIKMHGYSHEELLEMFIYDIDPIFTVNDFKEFKKNVILTSQEFETTHINKLGKNYPVQVTSTYHEIDGEEMIMCFVKDLSSIKKTEKLLFQYEKIVSSSNDSMLYIDKNYRCEALNQAFCNAFGVSKVESEGKYLSALLGSNIFENNIKPYVDKSILGEEVNYSTWLVYSDNKKHYVKIKFFPYKANNGDKYEGVVINLIDITKEKVYKDSIEHMAMHDTLTNLPNRTLFYERAYQALSNAKRHNKELSLLFIDLDHFKRINDNYGHDIGDKVLKKISQRMKSRIRNEDTLSRIGGDEFLLLIENIEEKTDIEILAQELLDELVKPIIIDDLNMSLSGSIGIAFYPDDATNLDKLVSFSDKLMYLAKKNGKNTYTSKI